MAQIRLQRPGVGALVRQRVAGGMDRTTPALHMSAFDPKRTSAVHCGNGF